LTRPNYGVKLIAIIMINNNITIVRQHIKHAAARAGRAEDAVRLICVTKEANSAQILDAISQGATDLGENRIQDALLKHRAIGQNATWHLIGHLQTNKVRDAVKIFQLIHSVDSLRLAQCIDTEAGKIGKVQDMLIQVNVSGEKTKYGIPPSMLGDLLEAVKSLANLRVQGLMTVTPLADDGEGSRKYFAALKRLRDTFGLVELSMGMTQDYEIAIEEGATMVRVGRAIFKE